MKLNPYLKLKFATIFRQNDQDEKKNNKPKKKMVYMCVLFLNVKIL